ncbi:MAG: nicotinate-nucleotide adenylyltransferase [Proteobacteria bacterium]|nr:nicotinate-nucleotide adenylyltransferase [Pseudomonadota bacterium]MBU4295568.1 nicotinate-nucleotide adenylyltransferase [Pseudomonadota bacterium]MCG2747687.1 nicotinate-nucleotide adenylyltransferase [Desulfobulbaceae bacterium]
MKKIGLFGGTFDPVHNGHLAVGQAGLRQLGLDTLYFIPASSPPHKSDQLITPFTHRVAMLRLAVQGEPRFVVSDIEGLRSGPSYTIDTLMQFRRNLGPEADFFFIIGLDAFADITTWKKYQELLNRTAFVVIDRPSHGCMSVAQVVRRCFPDYQEEAKGIWGCEGSQRIYALEMEPVPVSSSMIRDRLRRGEEIGDLIPAGVVEYLQHHRLFPAAKEKGGEN